MWWFSRRTVVMKLIVGLGNPGRKYEGTRHNVGFDVLDQLAKQHGCSHWKERFAGQTAEVRLGDASCLLLKPLTLMKRSGRSVGQASRFFKLEAADVLIICDDFHLPLGRLRLRAKGSAGGQKYLNFTSAGRLRVRLEFSPKHIKL